MQWDKHSLEPLKTIIYTETVNINKHFCKRAGWAKYFDRNDWGFFKQFVLYPLIVL